MHQEKYMFSQNSAVLTLFCNAHSKYLLHAVFFSEFLCVRTHARKRAALRALVQLHLNANQTLAKSFSQ